MAKILVIDDDKDILRLLEFTLKRLGHEVLTSVDGRQGLTATETHHPDLVVADVMMPKMTGYQFCKHVRANPTLKDIPIIVFSARFQPIDKQTALDAGATDYLPKSISPDILIERINELLPNGEKSVATISLGFFSLRGGTGVTSLAVNTTLALAFTQQTRATLIDLTPLGGHAALMLGLRPTSSVANALGTADDLSLDTIKPHLIEHSSGLHLLASTLAYDQQLSIADSRLEQLTTTLQSAFPITVFDIPHQLEPGLSPVLKRLDKIVVVLSPGVPSLQSTGMALQGLRRLGVSENNILLLVNQIRPESVLPIKTIEQMIKRPVNMVIPFEPHMVRAVNNGKPLLIHNPDTAGAVAITQFANKLGTVS